MHIRDYRAQFINTLTPFYDAEEAESFFYLVLEDKHNLKRVDLALNPKLTFTASQQSEYNEMILQLKKYIPIQYILGTTHFYGLDFEVNCNVLIPRPETEELVDWILSNYRTSEQSNNQKIGGSNHPKILDIGTGSGCIAIALAKNLPNAHLYAIDISVLALATAKKNAEHHNAKVTFIETDILKTNVLNQQFDIIVSNPPYVRQLEKSEIRKNVLEHEPHLALFVDDDDALVFYKKIVQLAKKNLNPNGQLYFEINQYMDKEMMNLMETAGFKSIELRHDIFGNKRMLRSVL